jgi:hypothetical protein
MVLGCQLIMLGLKLPVLGLELVVSGLEPLALRCEPLGRASKHLVGGRPLDDSRIRSRVRRR